jgi:transcriptional regulator with XRE-family HTH domain
MEKIKIFRKRRGLTQEQLAEMVGLTRSVISKYESGMVSPNYVMLNKIAGALGVPISLLVEQADPVIDEKTFDEALEYAYLSKLDDYLANMTAAEKDLFFRLSLAQADELTRYNKEHNGSQQEQPEEE